MSYRKLWTGLSLVILGSLAVLGYYGWRIYQTAPPIPDKVVSDSGKLIYTGDQIRDGQNVWQSIGGQEVGSVWGHGAYVAPDWSADWLHRELVWMLDTMANRDFKKRYASLDGPTQASLRERLKQEIHLNRMDPNTKTIVISDDRAAAIADVEAHYTALFGNDASLSKLRDAYAIPPNTLREPERLKALNAFFFWAAWACATDRPDENVTYTQNWPPEELIDNRPSGQIIVWSVVSFVLLLAGVGALSWYSAAQHHNESAEGPAPASDPLRLLQPTPSMRATLKYFWIVAALVVLQVGLGAVTAHYGVEGNGFYGIPLSEWLPYSVTRTWLRWMRLFGDTIFAVGSITLGIFVLGLKTGWSTRPQQEEKISIEAPRVSI
jgi:nitric oxide reductase subunit B